MPVIFKNHPSTSVINHKEYISQDEGKNLIIENRNISINQLIDEYNPLAAICCLSGVVLEMLVLRVPVMIFRSNEFSTTNPIVNSSSKVPVLRNRKGVIDELTNLKSSISYQRLRIDGGFECATNLVATHGDNASQHLAQIVSTLQQFNQS